MKIIKNKSKLIKILNGQNDLGLVPTMGAIHNGHKSLINICKNKCKRTIVTIFVNKPQFNQKKDYKNYPRVLISDISILKKMKVDFLYIPKEIEIYPNGPRKIIEIDPFEKKLCGKFRPGHFKAVVDVVDRFIKIIKPKKIFLGEKDRQQLEIIRVYVNKYHKKVKVIGCKTIREKNGIAYSSRNSLLTKKEKSIASRVYKFLMKNKKFLIKNKSKSNIFIEKIKKFGPIKIDYLEVININNITDKKEKTKKNYKIFIAYYLGKTRLIDNF